MTPGRTTGYVQAPGRRRWATVARDERVERLPKKVYEAELFRLQGELVKLQEWVRAEGARVVVVFEGRDAAGEGSTIKRVSEYLNPRLARIAALPAPTERERSQWYVQRYVQHFPAAGEIVLFDRSWYNRAGVERGDGVGLRNPIRPLTCCVVPVRCGANGHDGRHERLVGVPAAALGAADVDPARPRRRGQGRRTVGAAPPDRGAAPTSAPARPRTRGPSGAGRLVPAAAPAALVSILRHPGDPAALAPGADRPALDVSTRQTRPPAGRQADPRAGAAVGCREPVVGASTNSR